MTVNRFRGEICGVGTSEGTRIVVGRWTASPFGPFADAMVERRDGRRVLIAPPGPVAPFVSEVYEFDEIVTDEVTVERRDDELYFAAGPLELRAEIGERDPLGWLLWAVPECVAASRVWATVVDPLARVALNGVRTRGTTSGGREYYGALDRHRVTSVAATWDGVHLGELRNVTPAVRFGFSSTPPTPSIVRVVTTVVPLR